MQRTHSVDASQTGIILILDGRVPYVQLTCLEISFTAVELFREQTVSCHLISSEHEIDIDITVNPPTHTVSIFS